MKIIVHCPNENFTVRKTAELHAEAVQQMLEDMLGAGGKGDNQD